MVSLFEKAKLQFDKKLPFALYCKPNSTKIIGVFQDNDTLHSISDFNEVGFAFVSFDGEKKLYLPFSESSIYVDTQNETDFILNTKIENVVDESAKNNFENLVKKGVEAIKNKEFEKVVVSRKETIEIADFDFELIFKKLIFNYKTAFNYCFYHPKIGFWIGATPEQFLKVDENKLKTVALAGTQLFSDNIVWQNKEKEEQQLVTDFIVNNLKQFSDEVLVSNLQTIQAGNLAHLKTDIEAKIDENDLGEIIKKMHPTPAVCGLPKDEAKKFILNNEDYNRDFYTGFIGELNCDFTTMKNKTDLFVNLRCMNIENNFANLYIGCGITKDSIAEKEFVETVNKSVTMKMVL